MDRDSQADADEALSAADELRTRWETDEVRALLRAAKVATVGVGETMNADVTDLDGRQLSVSVTDLFLSTSVAHTPAVAAGDWIHTAAGQGELAGDVGDTAVDTTFDTAL